MKIFSVLHMELASIGALAVFVVLMVIISFTWREKGADLELKIWRLKAHASYVPRGVMGAFGKSKQVTKQILLGKEHYYMGNRIYDDIYIKTPSQPRVRAYLNVHEDKIIMTVLKGKALVNGAKHEADCRERIILSEFTNVSFAGAEIAFQRLKNRKGGC